MVHPLQQKQYVNPSGQPVYLTQVTEKSYDSTYEHLRGSIPIMPMPLAVFCCIWNFVFPGMGELNILHLYRGLNRGATTETWIIFCAFISGTVMASFCVFCCANPGQSAGGKFGCFCLNFWIGWLQLFTVWIFLIGWIWSIMWGWAFIALSGDEKVIDNIIILRISN